MIRHRRRLSPRARARRAGARDFLRDQRGSTLILCATGMMAIVGFAALVVDGGYLYGLSNKLQTTADAAALAGVSQIPDEDAAREAALAWAVKNLPAEEHGAVLTDGDVALGTWDSASRTFTPAGTPTNSVRVVTRRSQVNGNPAGLFFARALGFESIDLGTSAVALYESLEGCVIALDPSADKAMKVSGTADVDLGCGVIVNSTSDQAIDVNGNACLNAESIAVAGDYDGDCVSPAPTTGTSQVDDPLGGLAPPAYSGCDHVAAVNVGSDTTLTPGVYCGGILIDGGNVEFAPGTYVISGLGMQITGNATVTGDEVMFYMDPATVGLLSGGSMNSLRVAGTTEVTLRAPTSGPYEGILFFQDPASDPSLQVVFTGGADMFLEGVIYAPNNKVVFSGNNSATGSNWISIVSRLVEFTGTSSLDQDLSQVAYSPNAIFVTLRLVD